MKLSNLKEDDDDLQVAHGRSREMNVGIQSNG